MANYAALPLFTDALMADCGHLDDARFGLYLSHFNSYSNTYGALGGGIIFLTWLWLSAIALLFGAEINDVLDHMRTGVDITQAVDDGPTTGLG